MSSPPKLLLLPVPHATPYHHGVTHIISKRGEMVGHLSDPAALPFALQLKKAIEYENYREHSESLQEEGWLVEIIGGNESRVNCDLNRVECRGRPWRRSLHSQMKTASLLIDVHSFPPEHRDLHCYFIVDENYYDYCTLVQLNEFLVESGVQSRIFQGSQNDIIDEAYEMNLCAILFEINEGNSMETNQFIAKKIAQWLNRI